MDPKHTYCIIMAGGIGSRFWPMSRTGHPKQFLDFLGLGRTLIQQTFDRFSSVCPPGNIYVVTNSQYAELVRQQLPALRAEQVLLEPGRRNTAPCIAYANHAIAKRDPAALIITAPSDHLVKDEDEFQARLKIALEQAAAEDCLVTLGIKPDRPDTGYGYIRFSDHGPAERPEVRKVEAFTEKPDHPTAQQFLQSGRYLWNSGIFIWSLPSIRRAFGKHLPEMESLFSKGEKMYGTPEEANFIASIYNDCQNISIDYGILEKADNVFVVAGDFGWSDLGTWGSLYNQLDKDGQGNTGTKATVRVYDGSNNMVHVADDRLVVLQGLEDYIVVSTPDALLVCRKHDEQKIKGIVQDLTKDTGERYI